MASSVVVARNTADRIEYLAQDTARVAWTDASDLAQHFLTVRDATRAAMREAFENAGAVLLEPMMKVEVTSPEEFVGSVIGDLNSRRGQIVGTSMRGNANIINALVPLANMFGYINNLRSMSQGRASYTMQFDHYAQVPGAVAEDIKKKYA